jgi:hypothetical protein
LLENARWYAHLREDAGWKRLHDKIVSQRHDWMTHLARRMMRGEQVDPLEVATNRGFILGALYAVRHPEQAEANLTTAARIAWLIAQDEITNPEEDAPYG